ncbi:hypothetical protein MPER_07050 [Moniliophthora perniciosa FA553]|nr:hypothetical protein MPER_07050 [Moniliophthora perniciosa FA553]
MAPKKAKKISLNEFLGDSALGSWADEMDSLPSAPAMRADDDQGRSNDRLLAEEMTCVFKTCVSRHDYYFQLICRLPTQPPYTAFVGNLAFDLTEAELEDFFASAKPESVKDIRDRDDQP